MSEVKFGFEYIHNDLYGVAIEIAKKFVCPKDTRPILKYVQHRENGDIYATDSHRLIHVRNIHGFKEEYLVNPKTLTFAKGDYPNAERMLKREKYKETILLTKEQIKTWLQMFKSINQMFKTLKIKRKTVKLIFSDDENKLHVELVGGGVNDIKISLPCIVTKPEFDIVGVDPEYMRDLLEGFYKFNSEQVTFYFDGAVHPIIADDEKLLEIVVLPVRSY